MEDYLGEVDLRQSGVYDATKVDLVNDDGSEIEMFKGAIYNCLKVHPFQDELGQVKLIEQVGGHLVDIEPGQRLVDGTVEVSALDRGRRDRGEVQTL